MADNSTIPVRIELTPEAKACLEQIAAQRGMTQLAMLSRLVEWFASQDQKLQHAVMGHYPAEFLADIAKLLLKGASKQKPAKLG